MIIRRSPAKIKLKEPENESETARYGNESNFGEIRMDFIEPNGK